MIENRKSNTKTCYRGFHIESYPFYVGSKIPTSAERYQVQRERVGRFQSKGVRNTQAAVGVCARDFKADKTKRLAAKLEKGRHTPCCLVKKLNCSTAAPYE